MKRYAFPLILICLVLLSGSISAANFWDNEYSIDDSTLVLLHFNDNSGTTATDENSNSFDFTLDSANMWDDVTTKFGVSSLNPRGNNDAVNNTLFDVPPDVWTMEAWISPNLDVGIGSPDYYDLWAKYNSSSGLFELSFDKVNGKLRTKINGNGTGEVSAYSAQTSWDENVWYHVAIIYDSNVMCINVDGIGGDCVATNNLEVDNQTDFFLGVFYDGSTNRSQFKLDEFRISDINRFAEAPPAVVTDLNIWKIEDYPNSGEFPTFTYGDDENITIDFNVFNSNNSVMTADINYHTSNSQGTGTILVDDVNLSSLICTDPQEWDVDDKNCSWDFNILGVPDDNYYILIEITDGTNTAFATTSKSFRTVNQTTTVTILDENFGYPLVSQTLTFNGVEYTPDLLGQVTLLIGGLTGRYTVKIEEDNNYPARYFDLDLNSSILSWNLNFYMLQDNNAHDVDFKFYDTDETTILSNKKIYVLHDGNFAGIRYTNASGEVSFVVDPDDNYIFDVVKSESDVQRFHPAKLTIQIPKDETTLANITPFDASGKQLAKDSWSVQSATITSSILTNTVDYYVFDINAGASYHDRTYSISVLGDTASYSLQPYLTAVGTTISGNYVFSVKNNSTRSPIPNVVIQITKIILDEGEQEIASLTTDATGTATISLQYGEEYSFYFYYDGSLLSSDSPVIPSASSSSFLKYLSIPSDTGIITDFGQLGVFCIPTNQTLFLTDSSIGDINVGVNFSGKTLSEMRITLIDSNGVVWDSNYFVAPWTDGNLVYYDLNLVDFNLDRQLRVMVDVNSVDGNSYKGYCSFSVFKADQWALPNLMADFREKAGVGVTSFVAVFITLLAVGGLTMTNLMPGDPLLLAMLTLFLLWGFVAVGFLDLLPILFVTLFAVFFAILTRAVM